MKRRKRLKKKFFILIIIILIGFLVFYYYKNYNSYNNIYSKDTIKVLKDNNIKNINKYSKTLDTAISSNNYDVKYLNDYMNIDYIDKDNFISTINIYLNIGYNSKDVNNIFKLSDLNQEKLLNLNKVDFTEYINIKNFDVNKIDRYNAYLKDNNYDLDKIVTYVNINLDKPFYTDTYEVDDSDSLLVIVNKYSHLTSNYKPKDLVYVDGAYGNKVPFREVLKDSFINLQDAAKKEININLMPTTAFRDESFQTTLYNKYVASDGKEKADTYSARPGYSEHQTGLAIDLKNMALTDKRLTDDNYKWLENNAYKYGFIIRYPKDKEFITGYEFENWHIRYVGKDNAKIIHDNNLTLEEYVDLYIVKY